MPGNALILFGLNDVPEGESLQKTHPGYKGWIEISDWSFDIEAEHSANKGTGASVGKPNPGNLNITHYFDTSSPKILEKIVTGKHFPNIKIEVLKTTGGKAPEVYFQVQVAEAYVTKVSTKATESGEINQEVEFAFKEIYVGYKAQKDDGSLDGSIPFEWSVKTNSLQAASIKSGKL